MNRWLAALAVMVVTTSARADEPMLRVVPPTTIEATLDGVRQLRTDQLVLRDGDRTVTAAAVTDFAHGKETLAIALVVEGDEDCIGVDALDDDVRKDGLPGGGLRVVREALRTAAITRELPAGSVGTLVVFGPQAEIKLPLGPVARLTDAALGSQKDYLGKRGANLAAGVELALAELEKSAASRRLLVVIGDGSDVSPDGADRLRALRKRAAHGRIALAPIVYRAPGLSPKSVIGALDPEALTVDAADGLAAALRVAIDRATDRTTVTFPAQALTWDGTAHDLTVVAAGIALEPVPVVLPDAGGTRPRGPLWWLRSWWAQLGLGLAIVGVLILFMRWRASRQKTYR